jgi:predicted RNA-binding protein with PIN domain
MRNYQQEINAYTKGYGKLSLTFDGYDTCHNSDQVIEKIAYDSERDVYNPTGSVFCSQGSGYLVPWDEVKKHMHVESYLKPKVEASGAEHVRPTSSQEDFISLEEIDAIMNSTYYSNQGKKNIWKKRKSAVESHYDSVTYKGPSRIKSSGEEYLLVDGYNMIFAWPELEGLAKEDLGAARNKLMDILSNYQGIRKCHIMLVFDAYRVEGRGESVEDYHNIRVVYTAEAQTADQYIERFAHSNRKKYRIIVATSDGLQQVIIRGAGANLLSARELHMAVMEAEDQLSKDFLNKEDSQSTRLEDMMSEADKEKLKKSLIKK